MANQRIKYNTLPSNFVDGRILNAEDLNKIIRFSVAGINSNKADIDKLLSGKYNSHVFYSLSELTPNVGEDGDYAFIFFSEDISGENRDTLKLYKKEIGSWNELGDISLIALYEKLKILDDVDITHVGTEQPVHDKVNVWIKVMDSNEQIVVQRMSAPNVEQPTDLSGLKEIDLEEIKKEHPNDLEAIEEINLDEVNALVPNDLEGVEEIDLDGLNENKPNNLDGLKEI